MKSYANGMDAIRQCAIDCELATVDTTPDGLVAVVCEAIKKKSAERAGDEVVVELRQRVAELEREVAAQHGE